MSRLILLGLLILGAACNGDQVYQEGYDDGCLAGAEDGGMYGGIDASLCLGYDDAPSDTDPAVDAYELGWNDGYHTCFRDSYGSAYDFATRLLDTEYGSCDSATQ